MVLSLSRSPKGSEPSKRTPEITRFSETFALSDHLYSRSTRRPSVAIFRFGARSQDRSRPIAPVTVSSLPSARTNVFAVFGSSSIASSFACATWDTDLPISSLEKCDSRSLSSSRSGSPITMTAESGSSNCGMNKPATSECCSCVAPIA